MTRPSIPSVMMVIAEALACRATCARRSVGAVITTADHRILSTGYNGPHAGQPHCTDTPCAGALLESGAGLDRCAAVHAEQNALVNCTDITRAHNIYVTTMPCVSCTKLLLNTAIRHIYFRESYPQAEQSLRLWLQTADRTCTLVEE